ncbi:sorbosone dehydrogenase family protein [Marivirga arenosa]|uniref:Sorbosone dehydrogenase family protein n=1 Tax=Marivirga arenosa TaxID=3059076 RepID=A0AA51N554_9BACT|nr:sorbosone dehydrogenase family protein [Marivirga sp. ABR2-2]WMN06399.1 sorbosone dehydrogenase family protein [Marivirga sp. ABR2-2]
MKLLKFIIPVLAASFLIACGGNSKENKAEESTSEEKVEAKPSTEMDSLLSTLNLPEGFEISVYAEVPNARSMALSESGTLYVGNRQEDKVYAVKDTDGDGTADKKYILAEGLNMPNGVALKDGDLYVAEVSRILKFADIENSLESPSYEVIYDEYPTDKHHGWKYIAFGPDGKLYVPVGAPCNICNNPDKPVYASITRMNPDGTNMEVYAHGVRNTVGFTWHPETQDLYFTDNGRDMLGDDIPPCELNVVTEKGQHFGYPFCHGGTIKDPEFGDMRSCDEFKKPYRNLGPHVAPLGLKFYTANQFPEKYHNQIFIAEHGSWNRSKKIGYRIQMVSNTDEGEPTYETFINGWLDHEKQEAWGRPVDVLLNDAGDMLISDDLKGVIYKVSYKG